jgi:elongation factor 2
VLCWCSACLTDLCSANVIIATYPDAAVGDVQVSPEKGTVAFGSGKEQWAFTLGRFAKLYASKFGVDKEKMMKRLWGNNFYDAPRKKWVKQNPDGKLTRAFCQFIWQPIQKVRFFVMCSRRVGQLTTSCTSRCSTPS